MSVLAHSPVATPLGPGTTTKDCKNERAEKLSSEGTVGHNSNLLYFDLLAQTFSCLLCPFKIIEGEGWLSLTTSVF